MYVASRFPVPVGLVRWRTNATCYSPFVKVTYDLGVAGWALPRSANHLAVSEGEIDKGRVLFPNDFADAKGACEVAIVGGILTEPVGPVRLRVGGLTLEGGRIADLGPATLGGGRDYFTVEDHRLPFPNLPLEILVEGIGPTIRSLIGAPQPMVALAFGGEWASLQRVPLFIDAILVDPRHRRCNVLFRGFFAHPGDLEKGVTLVVDPLGRLDEASPNEIAEWHRTRATVARDAATESDDEDFTPPLGHRLERDDPKTQPVAETTVEMRAIREAEAAEKEAPTRPSTAQRTDPSPPGGFQAGETLPITSSRLPTALPFGPSGSNPPAFQRPRAQSGRPVPSRSSEPNAQSVYAKTQALQATSSSRQTLPFVAPEMMPKAEVRPKAETPAATKPAMDRSETTQLISMAAIRPKQNALPFASNTESVPRRSEEAPSEARVRPKHVPFEPVRADDESTEIAQAPPVSNDQEMETSSSSTAPPPPPSSNRATLPPAPPPRGSFDGDEGTAQIELARIRPALPFGGALPTDAPTTGSTTAPTTAPTRPLSGEQARNASDAEPSPLRFPPTMPPPPPAPTTSDAPVWLSPTGASLPIEPARAVPLDALRAGVVAPLAPLETAKPVWRPQEVSPLVVDGRSQDKVPSLTLDEYAALRAELWSQERPRREVLRAHGLSELRWRVIERKWAAVIETSSHDADKLMPILARLQRFANVRPT